MHSYDYIRRFSREKIEMSSRCDRRQRRFKQRNMEHVTGAVMFLYLLHSCSIIL